MMFVSYLAKEGLAHQSIKVYLSAVRNLHVSAGLHSEFTRELIPKLQLVLTGIKKDKAKGPQPNARLPVTADIMAKIEEVLHRKPHDYDNLTMWAACCLAFFGFLRCGEFTVPSQASFDPEVHLSLTDVAIDNRTAPTLIRVTIKQSKTDPFRQGVQVCLGKTEKLICSVRAIIPYLKVRGPKPGPCLS